MTKDTADSASSNQNSRIGKRGAAEIPLFQRIMLGLFGAGAIAGGTLLILRDRSPELGGTALVIIGALFLSLMVIGRLPKMLEIAGVPLEFEQDEMAEFLLTLRAAVDSDTLSELEDQLKSMSANSQSFKAAQKKVDEAQEEGSSLASAPPPANRINGPVDDLLADLKTKEPNLTVEKEARILGGPGSGRGQPPRVDQLVRSGEQPIVVLEEVPAWNVSTLEVLGRRLNRVMSNHPGVEKLIVIVPDRGLEAATKWQTKLWGDMEDSKVKILPQSSEEAAAVRNWIDSLPARHSGPAV